MQSNDLLNKGMILRRGRAGADLSGSPRTFIISGIGRGGTTLVAAILRESGIFLGKRIADPVNEDMDMLHVLRADDAAGVDDIISERNALGTDWGFKVPHIAAYLNPDEVQRFRNPHLILIFRDPVAIAVRHALAEYGDPSAALEDTTIAMNGLAHFFNQTTCPALLLS
jgi:hypothetical protein